MTAPPRLTGEEISLTAGLTIPLSPPDAMDLLNQLWDDTLAGPRPDYYGRSHRSPPPPPPPSPSPADPVVTRTITVLRPPPVRVSGGGSGSLPSSPAGSTAPNSPFSPTTPRRGWDRLRRKLASEASERAEPRSPAVYDWIVISSLDR